MAFIGDKCEKQTAPMEDALEFNEDIAVLADGHGGDKHGLGIATFACQKVMEHLVVADYDPMDFYETMPKLFAEIHESYLEKMVEPGVVIENYVPMKDGFNIRGGTTLTATVHKKYKGREYIMTANVGDSDAFLFTKKGDKYYAQKLTKTHKPDSEEEYFRIQKCGHTAASCVYDTQGVLTSAGQLPIFHDDGTYVDYEPTYEPYSASILHYHTLYREFKKAQKMDKITSTMEAECEVALHDYKEKKRIYFASQDGRRCVSNARNDRATYVMWDAYRPENSLKLSVTRAIGDYYGNLHGISPVPDVYVTWLDTEDLGDQAVLFVASDGILDCYELENLAEIVMNYSPATLTNIFHTQAESFFGSDYDDMSYAMKWIKK